MEKKRVCKLCQDTIGEWYNVVVVTIDVCFIIVSAFMLKCFCAQLMMF